MDRALRWLATVATVRPIRTPVVVALLTVAAGGVAGGLDISTSRTALVSEEDPHWKRYMAFAKAFGIPEDLVVVLQGPGPEAVHKAADRVAEALLDDRDHVRSVFYRVDLSAFADRAPLFLGYEQIELLERLAAEPALSSLRAARSAAQRVDAINRLFARAPTLWTEGTVRSDVSAMAALVRAVLLEMRQYVLVDHDGTPAPLTRLDPALLAGAVGNPLAGSGLDPSGYLTTDGGRTAVLFVRPRYHADELSVVAPFVAAVRQTCRRAISVRSGVRCGLTGIPASEVDELTALRRDTAVTSVVALLGVIALFFAFFPSLRMLALALVPIGVGVIWTAAAARLLFGYLNLISSVFLVILIGMGIDFSIHLGARFLEFRADGQDATDAARDAIRRAGRGILTGGLTSVGAFAAVGLSEFKAMAELGVVSATGLLLTMLAALTAYPAALIVAGPSERLAEQGFPSTEALVSILMKARRVVCVLFLVATIPMAWLLTQTRFDFSLPDLLPKESESARLMAQMVEKREMSANAVIAIAPDAESARQLHDRLQRQPSILRVTSVASFLPMNQDTRLHQFRSMLGTIASLTAKAAAEAPAATSLAEALQSLELNVERLQDLAFRRGDAKTVASLEDGLGAIGDVADAVAKPEGAERIRARLASFTASFVVFLEEGIAKLEHTIARGPMTARDLPEGVARRFLSASGQYAVYAFPRESIWDRDALGRFIRDARSVAPDVTGFPETFYENTGVMRRGFVQSALHAAIAVALLLLFDLRSPRRAFIAMLPLACGAIWMLGTMRLMNVSYNLANIVALPLIIGVGIDNAVHLLHRYLQDPNLHRTFSRTGSAVVLSSLTTMVSFGALMLASHQGLASLGQVLFAGVGSCLLAAIALLPAGLDSIRVETRQ